jgi:DNA gyrase subunit A
VANTHTPVLFFSSTGKCYKAKVYQLPVGSPTSTGKALINIFPLGEGETVTNVMPMPEDEAQWDSMNIIFATTTGNIRRNDLSDFKDIRTNGKIAMKLEEEGEKLVGVRSCNPDDHILLASRMGNAVRFPVEAIRVFKSRSSTGVRGMKLKEQGDFVVSISILKGTKEDSDVRDKYLSIDVDTRIAIAKDAAAADAVTSDLPKDKIISMAADEEFILTVTENGFGKRSSAYEYRVTNRGGSGITNIVTSERNGNVVGSFPVCEGDGVILATDKGKLIRTPVVDIRIGGRATQGVTILKTADNEHVVTATRIQDVDSGESEGEGDAGVAEGETTNQEG